MEGKKNLCAMIPAELHARIMAEKESLKQSKKRGGPEKGHNNTATVSVAKKEYGIRHQAESAGKSSLKM